MNIIVNDPTHPISPNDKDCLIDFLFEHLEEFGDSKGAIKNCIDYAMKEIPSFGGYTVGIELGKEQIAAAVINHTGMSKYIPEHILVYIAVHKEHRGKGYGGVLMEQVLGLTQGDIALHVEPSNPAARLYQRFGFSSKYLEMRRSRS